VAEALAGAAVAATAAAGAVVIAHAQPRERQLSVLAAASKPRFHSSHEETVRYSAAIASRRKRAVLAAVADVDAAATTAADAAAVVTKLHLELGSYNSKEQERPVCDEQTGLSFLCFIS
jgi:hypothetical protein